MHHRLSHEQWARQKGERDARAQERHKRDCEQRAEQALETKRQNADDYDKW
jgi:hypothetical protein